MKRKFLMLLLSTFLCIGCVTSSVSAKSSDTWIKDEYVDYVKEICWYYTVSPELVEAIIETESSGNMLAYNGKYGCKGLMQINESVHKKRMKKLGVTNLYYPYDNILVGVDYIAELYDTYGDDTMKILMMYNGQSNAKQRAIDGTFSSYSIKIAKRTRELERVHGKHK